MEFLVEVCDPCEVPALGYTVNGVRVSDFYTPRYFDQCSLCLSGCIGADEPRFAVRQIGAGLLHLSFVQRQCGGNLTHSNESLLQGLNRIVRCTDTDRRFIGKSEMKDGPQYQCHAQ